MHTLLVQTIMRIKLVHSLLNSGWKMRFFLLFQFLFLFTGIVFTILSIKSRFYTNKVNLKITVKVVKPTLAFRQQLSTVSKEKIKEKVFLLHFSIIVKEAFNLTKLKFHGFSSSYRFFLGDTNSMKTPFDWRGVKNSTIQSKTRETVSNS